jgi:hypothetical protein
MNTTAKSGRPKQTDSEAIRYAKADVALLKQIAQPWPEVL